MLAKVIAAFNDMSIADPNARRREVGDEFDVDDARGVELVALLLVEPADPALPLPGGTPLRLGADASSALTPSSPTTPVVGLP